MPIRDTFWNIPHWAEIAQYVAAFLTMAIFVAGVICRVLRWRQGRPENAPVIFGSAFGRW